ncbi:Ig-like domain-containing protein [Dyadobacter diqingensis]|uniref:Ig-like domain-containing protein n=1 Tax=Dyadobacter diqingensis TaxID=2938121 RepID=UPI0020C4F417|nr:Ig-like domain-containing protein [Dyadobacter diqingensis]
MNEENYLLKKERSNNPALLSAKGLLLIVFFLGLIPNYGYSQYVHPNQAGRKGGDTGAGTGNQVVTSTYWGNAGSLYGQGVLMSVNKDGTNAASYYDFKGWPGDGSYPLYTTPHQGSDGKLYGTTFYGGTSNWGSVYTYDFANCSEFVISNSGPGPTGGSATQYANVNEFSDGKLYFPETNAGSGSHGALFRMDKDGTNKELLHEFKYNVGPFPTYTAAATAQAALESLSAYQYDGASPMGFVVEGADGKVYGSTYAGGPRNWGTWWRCNKDGSSYEIIRVGAYINTYKSGTNTDVSAYHINYPAGNVAQDQAGKIYITGYYGGVGNLGGIARMDPDGSNYQLLYSGALATGSYPYRGALIIDNKIFGTMRYGGTSNAGVAYSMNLDGTGYSIMKTFGAVVDGSEPHAGLSYDGAHLFGTTFTGGGTGAIGTLFKIKPDGTGYQKIHTFLNTALALSSACAGTNKTGFYAWYPSVERVTFANATLTCAITCIANPAACTAPATAPSLSAQTVSNVCSATTADLTTLNAAVDVTWHTAVPALASNRIADPTSVAAGTYYASYYDAVNDCYSTASSAAVTATIIYCNPTIQLNASHVAITTSVNTQKDGSIISDVNPQGTAPLSYTSVDCTTEASTTTTSKNGTVLVIGSTGSYTYYPADGFVGVDTFCVKICNGSVPGTCKIVTYTVTVSPEECDALGTVPAN